MCEPSDSTQIRQWLFDFDDLQLCRARANRVARKWLRAQAESKQADDKGAVVVSAVKFACEYHARKAEFAKEDEGALENAKGHPYLTPDEESLLVSFYVSKLPSLVGPFAQVPRLRRESKVTATAALILRRFYLSNSVMVFDPKTIMVAAAFLATKVEDATTDVRYLEEGTNLMNAPVLSSEIIPAEIHVLSGINFDLLCFHPYKAVLSLTEDLRTYLKSEKGKMLVSFPNGKERTIVGQDLKPMHDAAQQIVNDVIVSDLPLMYAPAQIGMSALMVANEKQASKEDVPQIDLLGYLMQRFEKSDLEKLQSRLQSLSDMLKGLPEGKHGCANHHMDMKQLKSIHKKLKKVRVWGVSSDKDKEKKKKKRKAADDGNDSKRQKKS